MNSGKWISLVDNGSKWSCLINMNNLTKIFMDESHGGNTKSYSIVFRDMDKSQGHITFSSREKRDGALDLIQDYITDPYGYLIELKTDIM